MIDKKEQIQRRVALYIRVSTEEQAEKYGPDAQRAAIESMIKSRGELDDGRPALVLAGKNYEYVDDISGTTDLNERPGFSKLIEDVVFAPSGQKPFDVIAIYKIDRFARKLSILLKTLNFLEKHQIEFISTTETIDTTTPFGRAMLGIMGVIAELELETIRERTSSGKEQAVKKGVHMGTHAPYGYTKDENKHLIKFEKEAKVVKGIFDDFVIAKHTIQFIADSLTCDEILSPEASAVKNKKYKGSGKKLNQPVFWRADMVHHILVNDVYKGIQYLNKSKNGKRVQKDQWKISLHHHEPIVTTGIFELAQKRLEDLALRKELTNKKQQGHTYLLSGLLKCDHCKAFSEATQSRISWTGDKKYVKKTQKMSYYYRCGRKNRKKYAHICTVVPIPAEPLENYVISFIRQLLNDPVTLFEYQKQLHSSLLTIDHLINQRTHAVELLNNIPKRRQNLKDQQEIGAIDTATLTLKLEELVKKEKEYNQRMEQIDFQLTQEELSEGYKMSFEKYAEKYRKVLEQTFIDRTELYELIHSLIYEIIVYSRVKNTNDIIAGKKKQDQFIPDKIDITLNLPQHLLRVLYEQRFGVKHDTL